MSTPKFGKHHYGPVVEGIKRDNNIIEVIAARKHQRRPFILKNIWYMICSFCVCSDNLIKYNKIYFPKQENVETGSSFDSIFRKYFNIFLPY